MTPSTYVQTQQTGKGLRPFFDRNLVVVGTSHAHHVAEHIPDYWGIITVEEQGENCDFYMLREALENPKKKMIHKIRLLWRPELAHIQEINGMRRISRKARILCKRRYWRKSRKKCCKSRSVMNCSRGIIRPYRRR